MSDTPSEVDTPKPHSIRIYNRKLGGKNHSRIRRATIAALLAAPFIAGCGHAAAPVPAAVTLSFCGSNSQSAPTIVEVVCNTDDITARNLAWTSWGKATATADGEAVVDLCAYVDCHTGSFGSVPIKLVATRISACGKGKRAYTTLRYVFTDGTPWPGAPKSLNTSNYMVGSDRPLPPPDQTVGLTCA